MLNLFFIIPLTIALYESASIFIPMKINTGLKILGAVILLISLSKSFLYQRTATGFEIIELPKIIFLILSLIFSFLIVALGFVILKDLIWLVCKIFKFKFNAHLASVLILIICSALSIYGIYEGTKVPNIKKYNVNIPGLDKNFNGMKIIMLVDLHISELNNFEFVRKIVNKVNAVEPDLILMPGDFVDGSVKARYNDVKELKNLRAKFGVYGSTGNHEYYFDLEGWLKEFENFGIKILNNEHVQIISGDSKLIIAGTPDQHDSPKIDEAVKNIPENSPIILLAHRPGDAENNSKYNISFQISGHTHGGQIPILYNIVKKFNNGFVRGWYKINDMQLYVSPGTSEWGGFPLRIFDPSEITLFILNGV